MTHELILTSVSQGLESDSRGFCVVAKDRLLPQPLRERLESLCAFRHLNVENPALQPTVYSHVIFTEVDRTWHLLSRIADTGTDFRHEPNKLVHHIVLRNDETVEEGPAWLLALPEFHLIEWITPAVAFETGRPVPSLAASKTQNRFQQILREQHWLDPTKLAPLALSETEKNERLWQKNQGSLALPHGSVSTSPCPTWQEVVGDAGWAGILANTARTGQPAVLLFHPGMNLLPLFFEAIALLSSAFRWKVTFSTYYTQLPDHIACQWKGVLADSREAEQLKVDPNQLILDLTQPMGMAPAGDYVDFARKGHPELLPHDETRATVFQPAAQSAAMNATTHLTQPDDTPVDSAVDAPANADTASIAVSDTVSLAMQKRSSHKWKKSGVGLLFHRLLNMKSQERFYLIYGVSILLVLALLTLTADLLLDLGLTRWLRDSRSVAAQRKIDEAHEVELAAQEAARLKQELQAKTQQEREAAEHLWQKHVEAQKLRDDFAAKAVLAAVDLEKNLPRIELPDAIGVPIPPVQTSNPENANISFPTPKLFPELACIFPYGAGLHLEWVPLEPPQSLTLVTRKVGHDLEDETWIPDTSQFRWEVVAIDEPNKQEFRLFVLVLTEQGLEVGWAEESFSDPLLYTSLQSTLGHLQISSEQPSSESRQTRSVALFGPTQLEALSPHFLFGHSATWSTPMPFAEQPWHSLAVQNFPFVFRMEVQVLPEKPTGIVEVKIAPRLSDVTSDVTLDFTTQTTFQKPITTDRAASGNNQTTNIHVSLLGTVDSAQMSWTDLLENQRAKLTEQITENTSRITQRHAEKSRLQTEAFNNPTAQTQLSGINEEIDQLTRQNTACRNELAKLDAAHQDLLANKDLTLAIGVFLHPISPSESSQPERSLLILRTPDFQSKSTPSSISLP